MNERRFLIEQLRPYRRRLFAQAALLIAVSGITLAVPYVAGQLGAVVLASTRTSTIALSALLITALAGIAVLSFVTEAVGSTTASRLLADLRNAIYSHVQSLPMTFHETQNKGNVLALLTYEISFLGSFVTGTLVSIPSLLLTAAGSVLFMFRTDANLALIIPVLIPVYYLILKILGRMLRGLAENIQKAEANIVEIADESLDMLSAIKTFTREDSEKERYGAAIQRSLALTLRQNVIYAALEPLIGFIAGTAAVVLIVAAGDRLRSGSMTTAELISFLLYAALLTRPVASLAQVYGRVQTARGTLRRMASVLEQEIERGTGEGGRDAEMGDIEFRNVHFSYAGRPPVFSGLDFHVRTGEVVALTGVNGAGKSTIMGLLVRLYEPVSGSILIAGHDIQDLDIRKLREAVGIVPQRALLFNGSVRDNIAFGRHGASHEDVVSAAKAAQAAEFIDLLPQGYDTLVGDHGVRLSGGQRQRLALARAFIKDPPILVLDEATSMYDVEAEEAFIEDCAESLAGRTVILITHRAAALRLADRVIQIADGKAVDAYGSRAEACAP